MNGLEQIFYNIMGGAIVAILSWCFLKFLNYFSKRDFKKIFGDDSVGSFFLVYPRLNNQQIPYRKQYQPSVAAFVNVSSVVPFSETKAIKYLSETFGKIIGTAPKLISDEEEEIKDKLDVSFCSLGGYTNLKTIDLLEGEENTFFHFDISQASKEHGIIINKGNKEEDKKFLIDGSYDYATIIKIIPINFPDRVWIIIAGLGEWGTSGAAWFLSKKWKKLPRDKSFGLIIKVKHGKDESAEIVYKIEK